MVADLGIVLAKSFVLGAAEGRVQAQAVASFTGAGCPWGHGQAVYCPYSDRDFSQFPRSYVSEGGTDFFCSQLDPGPPVGEEDHDGHLPLPEVLLVTHALVGGYHDFVVLSFGVVQQVSISEFGPTPFSGGVHGVFCKVASEGPWDVVVKQDFHALPWRPGP